MSEAPTLTRAISLIGKRSLDVERRTFRGWATTPEPDRQLDTIDPLGATFRNPLVLLHQHRHDTPIGTVTLKKPTSAGIQFVAEIPVIEEPGMLKDRTDLAWGEIAAGLVRAVSIGFRPLSGGMEPNKSGGYHFKAIEIIELSTVSCPANVGARIEQIKAFDAELRASSPGLLRTPAAANAREKAAATVERWFMEKGEEAFKQADADDREFIKSVLRAEDERPVLYTQNIHRANRLRAIQADVRLQASMARVRALEDAVEALQARLDARDRR